MVFLSSLLLSFLFVLLGSFLFKRWGWMDKPHLYGHQRAPVPYGMGIVLAVVFIIASLFFIDLSTKLVGLMSASLILSLVCFWDDRKKLPATFRLLVQISCAAIVVLSGVGVPAITNPLGSPFVLDAWEWTTNIAGTKLTIHPLADLVAMLWIVFVINAMNWLDGSPGIVSGVSAIASFVLYLLATMTELHVIDQGELAVMATIIASASLVFLFFEFPPPKLLMGDSGTMFLGMIIATMAIYSGGKLATAFIVLAFPILDAVWTILRRIINKQSPFKGDFQHFHHELMRFGLSQKQVGLFYFAVSLGFGFAALYLKSSGKLIAIMLLFLLMAAIRIFLLQQSKKKHETSS